MIIFNKPWNLGYISTPGEYSQIIKNIILTYLKIDLEHLSELNKSHGFSKNKIIYCGYKYISINDITNYDFKKQFDSNNPIQTFVLIEDPINKLYSLFENRKLNKELPVEYRNANKFDDFVNILFENQSKHLLFKSVFNLLNGLTPDFIITEKNLIKNWKSMFKLKKLKDPEIEILLRTPPKIKKNTEDLIKIIYEKDYNLIKKGCI